MAELQKYHFPLVQSKFLVTAGATNEEITFGPVPTGCNWVLNWVTVENETSASTYLRGYIGGLGEPVFLFEERAPAADRLYWTETPIYIPEGRTLVLRFNTAGQADTIKAYINGYEVRQEVGNA